MADINLTNLTDATVIGNGTGIFDKLMQIVNLHITEQFDEGRVTGGDYAQVYLGSLQTVLQQAIQFLLQEQQADKQAELIALQIQEVAENLDLIAARTASEYEKISASQDNTVRENLKNAKEIQLLESRNSEQLAATIRNDAESTQKVLLMAAQTQGFVSDTKQKVLKQMLEGFSVVLSISGEGTVPDSVVANQIDNLAQEILADIGSSVTIP